MFSRFSCLVDFVWSDFKNKKIPTHIFCPLKWSVYNIIIMHFFKYFSKKLIFIVVNLSWFKNLLNDMCSTIVKFSNETDKNKHLKLIISKSPFPKTFHNTYHIHSILTATITTMVSAPAHPSLEIILCRYLLTIVLL